jgi:hypothetical protein
MRNTNEYERKSSLSSEVMKDDGRGNVVGTAMDVRCWLENPRANQRRLLHAVIPLHG